MTVHTFDELKEHLGHKIVCVSYRNINSLRTTDPFDIANVALECLDCNEVLLDYTRVVCQEEDKPRKEKK